MGIAWRWDAVRWSPVISMSLTASAGPPWLQRRLRYGLWFDAQRVVHRNPKLLLAPKIPLGRLDRDVTKEELNLIQFAAGEMAQARTGPSEVVRSEFVDVRASRGTRDDIPEHLRRHPVTPDPAGLVNRTKDRAVCDARSRRPRVDCRLDPGWHLDRADVSTLANEIRNDPVLLALLERLEPEGQRSATSPARGG